MSKGYWIVHVDVHDPDRYKQYVELAGAACRKFGVNYLVRGGKTHLEEGKMPGSRHVVAEFADVETALKCYNSDDYQSALVHRKAASTGTLVIVEGA